MTAIDVDLVRVRDGGRQSAIDRVAAEEPLEVRLNGRSFAVIMRTPGADRELAAGFLFSEGLVENADDIGVIEHCRDARDGLENVVNVSLTTDPARVNRAVDDRRQVMVNSSCGLCGRLTIDTLRQDRAPLDVEHVVSPFTIKAWPDRLRAAQPLFDLTGGIHAAALFAVLPERGIGNPEPGGLTTSAEDVGRHNAVDKVVGRMLLREALPLKSHALFVSGRSSFEIVQKAWFAGIPFVASVSAASSLAIDLAREAGITLIGFVRDRGFNIYAHPQRVE